MHFTLQHYVTSYFKYWRLWICSKIYVILGFRREVGNCAVLGYYAASSGNSLPTFRDNLWVPSSRDSNPKWKGFLILDDVTDILSRNVGKELPLFAA